MSDIILEVSYLTKKFPVERHFWQKPSYFTAVDDISFSIHAGETLGLLGESGCGKSTTARILMGLYPPDAGTVRYQGRELQSLSEKEYRPLRREIQMVFQNPFDSLDPGLKIRTLLLEPMSIWGIGSDRADRMKRIFTLCEECGMPRDCLEKLPSEFSGGQERLTLSYQTVSTIDDPFADQKTLFERIFEHQKRHERAEIDAGQCLTGPHKDDFETFINDRPVKSYGSQGQTRTASISLKLAERELMRRDTGEEPLLLLDDVLSELDAKRQDFVLNQIRTGQVLITCCETDRLTELGKVMLIRDGELI